MATASPTLSGPSGGVTASTGLSDSSNLARLDAANAFTNANTITKSGATALLIQGTTNGGNRLTDWRGTAGLDLVTYVSDAGVIFAQAMTSAGRITTASDVVAPSGVFVTSNSGPIQFGAVLDVGIQRNAAGMLEVNNGTAAGKAGIKFNGYTTTEKNAIASPTEGMVVYDLTLHKLCVRTAAAWETITSI